MNDVKVYEIIHYVSERFFERVAQIEAKCLNPECPERLSIVVAIGCTVSCPACGSVNHHEFEID